MIKETVGRYRILHQIGSGGMGEVYLAEDPKLQRKVALKILSDTDPSAKRRFVHEAIAASKLSHPSVAVVYEAGETEDGTGYIAMQYVEGQTLRDRMLREAMPVRDVVRIASEVADALDEAHRHGIIHRDIKPGNIMIDSRGRAKVLDFGIAKMLELDRLVTPEQPTDVAFTAAGMFVGTLQYVSPEQAGGGAVDRRSDIFSLGVVMYEMLSGSNPFAAPTFLETVRKIRELSPAPIARSDCPPELKRIVSRCLEKDPERRYQTARDVVLDLEGVGARVPRAGPARTLAATLAIGVMIAGLWFVSHRSQPVPAANAKINSIAVLPFVNFSPQRETEYIGDGISEEVINGLAQLSDLKVVARTSSFAFKGTRSDVREVGKSLGVDVLVEGSVQRAGNKLRVTAQLINAHDGYHLWSQTYSGAVDDVFSIEDQIARSVAKALQRTAGRTSSGPSTSDIAAYDLYLKARHDEMFLTRRSFDSAVANYRAAIQRDPSFAEAYAGLAETYSLMDHRPGLTDLPTTETYRLSVEAANKALSLDPDSVEAHTALGHIDMHHGLFGEARAHLDRALQLNPNFANAYLWRAVLLRTIGHYPEARKDAERAEQNDPYSGFLFTFWSSNAWMAGDYASALHAAQRGVEIEPQYGEVYVSLAKTYAVMGKFPEAEEALRRADELKTGAIAEYTRALELALSGRRREAAQLLKGMNNRAQGSSFQGLMRAWAAVGDVDETIRWIDRGVVETPDYVRVGMDLPPHPAFEAVRRDPRYLQARRKLGLPPISDTAGISPASP
jgi:TolB-like protein/Flp pilus assembly protein TadD